MLPTITVSRTHFQPSIKRFGTVDGIVHAVAYAKKDELGGLFLTLVVTAMPWAQDISSYSLIAVAKAASQF